MRGAGGGPVGERRLSGWLDQRLSGHWRVAELGLYVLAVAAAWIVRFVQDDAFITYRYARNLARGNGLVFNPGERVEGYTNFLWTVLHVIPEKFSWSTPVFSQVIGIAFMVGTVAISYRLARRVFGSEAFAFLVALALLGNMTFLTYATGGLETMMQTMLVVSVASLLLPVTEVGARGVAARRISAGLCAGLAVLTRMDSAVLIAVWVTAHLVATWRRVPEPDGATGDSPDGRVRILVTSTLQIGLPALALIGPWLAWKLWYYGNLLPNTFYAKSAGSPIIPPLYGLFYLAAFFFLYASFLLIGRFIKYRKELFAVPGVPQILAVLPVWFLYICVVGGDFMEFRFMVPVMPVLAMVVAYLVDRFTKLRSQMLLLTVLILISGTHRVMPTVTPYPVLTFTELSHWPNSSTTSWQGKATLLKAEFPGGMEEPGQPKIAIAPLGVLPYFSDLQAVDVLGLTDPVTARHGYPISPYYPGHVRMAHVGHLLDEHVNLILGQPGAREPVKGRRSYRISELTFLYPSGDLNTLPQDARVIEVPQIDGSAWLIIYLLQNDKVDSAIKRNGWAVYPVDRTCVLEDMDVVEGNGLLVDLANRISRMVGERSCPSR
ncbi:MAG: glycosyltransferase family 39 protein [Microthrixaceae bacterium]